MKLRTWTIASGCVVAGAVALPAAASAATKTVYEGAPPATQHLLSKAFANKYSPDANDFFLHKVTIHAGDAIKFVNTSFHDVDLPGPSGQDLPLFVPGPTVTGVNDAAGNPFWFDGHVPSLGFNPKLFAASGGSTYSGSTRVDSGLPLGPPAPFKVTFTKTGTYKYFCDIHPGMVGFVVVVAKGKTIPSASQDAAALDRQIKTDVASAKQLSKTKVKGDNVSLGVSDRNGVELYAMFPTTLSVRAGAVVTFSMSRYSREVHTATFGPRSYLTTLANSFMGPAPAQLGLYPSDRGTLVLSPTSHGNGFANTGTLDQDKTTTTVPSSGKIKFTKPGTYRFICVIHPGMVGSIVVH